MFLKNKNFILFSLLTCVVLSSVSYALSQSSSVKFGPTVYPQAMSTLTSIPPVACNVVSSDEDGTNLNFSFVSSKRASMSTFVNINLNLPPDEYEALMSGDTISFSHGSDFTSFIGSKVLFTIAESSGMASPSMITSTSIGSPTDTSSSDYMVMGTLSVLNKRDDGCLDLSFDATLENAPVSKVVTSINTMDRCISNVNATTIRTIASLPVSGTLYPVKYVPSTSTTSSSGSVNMLCGSATSSTSTSSTSTSSTSTSGIPSSTSSSTSGIPENSSGFTLPPGFGTSGFTLPPGFGSSGFTFPTEG